MNRKKYNIGFVGCGGIANRKHFDALQNQRSRIEPIGFCDIILERAQAFADRFGAKAPQVCSDYHELLQNPDIDVIYVLTPNSMHAKITIAALKAGKDVMCEKPMACNSKDAQAMCDAARKTGKKLTIGYQYRCEPEPMRLKKIVEAGVLEDIYYAEAHALRRRGVPNWGVFLDKQEQGGGALIDIGTHALDMTLWLMNNYDVRMVTGASFQKLGACSPAGNKFGAWDVEAFKSVDDASFGFIVMKNGAVISLRASWALNILDNREQKVTLCGTGGGADMDDGLRINGVAYGGFYEMKPDLTPDRIHLGETAADRDAAHWLNALDMACEVPVQPEQALVVTQILEAIYHASQTGQPVFFD